MTLVPSVLLWQRLSPVHLLLCILIPCCYYLTVEGVNNVLNKTWRAYISLHVFWKFFNNWTVSLTPPQCTASSISMTHTHTHTNTPLKVKEPVDRLGSAPSLQPTHAPSSLFSHRSRLTSTLLFAPVKESVHAKMHVQVSTVKTLYPH